MYIVLAVAGLGAAAYMAYRNRKLTERLERADKLFRLSNEVHAVRSEEELLRKAEQAAKQLVRSDQVMLSFVPGEIAASSELSADGMPGAATVDGRSVIMQMKARGRELGLLQAVNTNTHSSFRKEDVELLHSFTAPVALALDNARMYESLEQSVHELQSATAMKERLESELQIAGSIQLSFLPTTMPSANEPFDVCALLKSAKEVGGDFYNFYKIDEEHLFFTLGDVSDKGIPAALFMAMTLSLLKGNMNAKLTPGELLENVNDELCNNNAQLFATIVCGVLNIATGEVTLSDGGHCTPFIVKANGAVLPVKLTKGIPLGAFPEFTYTNETVLLEQGDRFVLYTDGITEAENAQQEQYSVDRLERFLGLASQYSSAEIIDALLMDVFMFADGAPQSDDIAVLCLMRR
ncbi:SpoIIE family protein phosphatase [Paenibacillus sp. HB172176]|uniref:PP2C family protein-serine/threonine phosphatase n=1 Tax=Paenibacillus sp. HB172176 TaxID=2493690 RepID=UPI001F0F4CAF|nr:SpoIIE family protein phosphatase [Paenibacillus sp. HB172176]